MTSENIHVIRLHGPWEASINGEPEVRIRVPQQAIEWVAENDQGLKVVRRFNCPTSLQTGQKVELELELDRSDNDVETVVVLNSAVQLPSTGNGRFRRAIQDDLTPGNRIEIRCRSKGTGSRTLRIASARLLISEP